jgi:hypothetical protein
LERLVRRISRPEGAFAGLLDMHILRQTREPYYRSGDLGVNGFWSKSDEINFPSGGINWHPAPRWGKKLGLKV